MDAKEALEMFEHYESAWSDIYRKAKDDLIFYAADGNQWSDEDRLARGSRPCIEVNVLPQFVYQVTNEIRQNTPHIKVSPSDSESSEETAKVLKGLIRKIEYNSNADEVYDTAAEYQVKCSIGFIRVNHDYIAPDSNKQHLTIDRVANPLACWIDPSSIESDGCDAMGAICLDTYSKEKFEEKWPDKEFVSFEKGATYDEKRESITIAEIFVKEYEDIESEESERQLKKAVIRRYLFSGSDMLEETTFPSEYIPIVPVYAQEVWIDNKRHLISLIRNAKDPQRRYNHWVSVEAEVLARQPIAPFIAAAGSIEEYEEDWTNPESTNVLRYDATDEHNQPFPMPQRSNPMAVSSGALSATQNAYEDIKRSLGLYDASVGQKSNETSGIAIQARQQQGNTATFHFPDNLSRSVAHVGKILVSAIPYIYNEEQIVQIINDEEEPEFAGINGAVANEEQKETYDLSQGKYDVRVEAGASYGTRKEEAAEKMGMILEAQPQMMGVFGDLWAKNLDIPESDKLAERIKRSIPPELTQELEEGQDPEVMSLRQKIEQMGQQMQVMEQELQSKEQEANMDRQEKAAELQLKSQELEMKSKEAQVKAANEAAKVQIEQSKLQLEAEKLKLEREKAEVDATEKLSRANPN